MIGFLLPLDSLEKTPTLPKGKSPRYVEVNTMLQRNRHVPRHLFYSGGGDAANESRCTTGMVVIPG